MDNQTSNRLTINSYYLILDQLVNYGLGFFFWLVLAKLLTPTVLGQVMAVTALAIAILGFTGYGTQTMISKHIAQYNIKKLHIASKMVFYNGLKIGIVVSLGAAIVISLFSNQIATSIFKDSSLASLIVLTMLVLLPSQTILLCFSGAFQGSQMMKYTTIGDFVFQIARMSIAVILVTVGFGNLGIVAGFAFGSVIAVLYAYLIFVKKNLFNFAVSSLNPSSLLQLAKFSGLNYLAIGLPTLGVQMSYLLLGAQSFDSVALFGISSLISGVVGGIIIAVGRAILPTTSEALESGNKLHFDRAVNSAFRLSLMVSGFIYIVLTLSPETVLSLLSKEYVSASAVLRILVLYGVITSMAAFIGSILNGLGKPQQFATMSITSSVIAIVLGIALVPFFGMLGASLSLLIGSIFNILLAAYFIKKEQFVSISLMSILKPIISVSTAILVGYIALTVIGSITVTLLLAFVAYLILIITCKVTTKSELKRLLQTVTKITH